MMRILETTTQAEEKNIRSWDNAGALVIDRSRMSSSGRENSCWQRGDNKKAAGLWRDKCLVLHHGPDNDVGWTDMINKSSLASSVAVN